MPESTRPLISVVMPVKNRSWYLAEALLSMQSQTVSEWECIVVDDHSTEDIEKVVASFNEPRFKYVRNTGKPGISPTRNLGNTLATAEWIAVADSDDINLPRRLEVTLQAIAANPGVDVVYSPMYMVKDGTYELRASKGQHSYDRKRLYEVNMIFHGSSAYRKDLITKVGYSEGLISAADYELWLSFADMKAEFLLIEEPLALYRRHDEQISTDPEKRMLQAQNADFIRSRHPYKD